MDATVHEAGRARRAQPRRKALTARNVERLRPTRTPTRPGEVVQEDIIDKDGPTGFGGGPKGAPAGAAATENASSAVLWPQT